MARARRRRRLALAGALIAGLLALAVVDVRNRWTSIDRIDVPEAIGNPSAWLILASDSRQDTSGLGNPDVFRETGPPSVDVILYVTTAPSRILVIPRELVLPGQNLRLADRFASGPGAVVAAVCSGLGLGVGHLAIVDFRSVGSIVDAIGGVPWSTDASTRDPATGLHLPAGEGMLDGEQAVALLRSRSLETETDEGWTKESDGRLGRAERGAEILERVASRVEPVWRHPVRAHRVLEAGTRSMAISSGTSIGDVRSLVGALRSASVEVLPDVLPSALVLRSYPSASTDVTAGRFRLGGDRCA